MTDLTGTPRLVRLALRRDRVVLPAWILGLGGFVAATTALFAADLGERGVLVEETQLVAGNAGMRLLGLTSGPSVGGYMLHREYVTLAALAALMSIFAVVRHTRQNEELGRVEMVGATVVGRRAGVAAAVVVGALADLVLAVVLAAAVGVTGQPWRGSLLVGASVAAVGLVFVGVAAITSQLFSTTRAASGMAAALIGLSFLVSGIGNMMGTVDATGTRVESAWPAWLSPIGWGQQMRPFGGDHAWPLALFVVLFVVLVAAATLLVGIRDVGRGLWPERRGRAHAAPGLLSPVGLSWRLQRGVLAGWVAVLVLFGLIFGALIEQITSVGGPTADYYRELGGTGQVVDGFRASMVEMAGMFVAMYVVQVLLRMRTDEAGGTLEPLLATAVTRARWVTAHLVNAVGGATLLLLAFGASMGITAGSVLGATTRQVAELAGAALAQLPGVLVVAAVVVAAVGMLPRRATAVSWVLVIVFLVIGPMFGPGLDLPGWLQDLSPFTHVPNVPATDLEVAPLLALTGVAVIVAGAGLVAVRRRHLLLPA
jgi:ABC-2 type transport system permease protein